jgi:phospholipid transport system substrate-binding protein
MLSAFTPSAWRERTVDWEILMLPRRSATAMVQATCVLMAAPRWTGAAWAQPAPRAVDFVQRVTEQLVAIVNSPGSPQEKRHSLQQVIEATVDVDDIAQFCLGRFWRIATPEQRHEYLSLFGDLLVTKIAAHLGEYHGVKVTMGLTRAAQDTEIVITNIERPNNPTYQVDWVISICLWRAQDR